MSNKLIEFLNSLDAEQRERAVMELKVWVSEQSPEIAPDYSAMSQVELEDAIYKAQRK